MNKSYLTTILMLFSLEKIFETLNKKYLTTNSTCFYQLFYNYQATNIQKIFIIIEKYKAMLNFNTEIYI